MTLCGVFHDVKLVCEANLKNIWLYITVFIL